MLGIENGDTLVDVDGHALSSPDAALEAYAAVRERERITIGIDRRDRRHELELRFVDTLSGPPTGSKVRPRAGGASDSPRSPDLKDPFSAH